MSIVSEAMQDLEEAPAPEVEEKPVAEAPEGEEAKDETKEEERQETPEEREARRARNRAKREAGKLRKENETLHQRLAELEKRVNEGRNEESTGDDPEQEIERRVQERLKRELEATKHEEAQKSFVQRLEAGKDDLPEDFDELVEEFADTQIPRAIEDALYAHDNPGLLLYHLMDNPSEIERLNSLSPVRLGMEIAKITAKAPKPKSAAPAPARVAASSATNTGIPHSADSADEWLKKRFRI